ncbi:MAG TPA: metalloregulator ArsR/SmtB family transcription factor [Thermodesulfobacteriota bacterium]|nr:metalloregulator ArsR/SmtB family transcription factor [Thermodesulfobacteriota bacterium]
MRALAKTLPAGELASLELTAKFFRGLGDPTRLKIVELLLEEERPVKALVERLGVPQGRLSSHLACLKWCGYVTTRRAGRYTFYRVADRRVARIVSLARQMVARNAEHLYACTRIEAR